MNTKEKEGSVLSQFWANKTIFGHPTSQIKWSNVICLSLLHVFAIYGFIHAATAPIKTATVLWTLMVGASSGFGISVGAHRLWAHRSFKARFPFQVLLVIYQTMSLNGSVYSYARDHRIHHKFSDTDADPKNSSRGFFFSHVGWWLVKKCPAVIEKGSKVSCDDLKDNPLLMFQHKFYTPLAVVFWALIPMLVPYYGWNETLTSSFLVCVCIRTVVVLHHMWTVNSIAHFYGDRPYDGGIKPVENKLVMYLSLGEGSHNYHHKFPTDYMLSEKSWIEVFNPSALFVDLASWAGFAHQLKRPPTQLIYDTIKKHDDGNKSNANKSKKIASSIIEWTLGGLCATWSVGIIVLYKLCTRQQLFYL